MTTIYKILDDTVLKHVCICETRANAALKRVKREKAEKTALLAAGVPEGLLTNERMFRMLCRQMSLTTDEEAVVGCSIETMEA